MALRQAFVDPRQNRHQAWDSALAPALIFVTMRVRSEYTAVTRQSLHQCLGDLIEIYTVQNDHQSGRSIFQIKLKNCSVDFLMHQIMEHLPEAEFGRVVSGFTKNIVQ
jgi:hypothetical protein